MRKGILSLIAAGLFAVAAVAQQPAPTIGDLNFIAGCWEIRKPDRELRIEEHWLAPAGGTMIGVSRSVRSGKTTGWEYMRLEAKERGIFFVSKPRENKEEAYFRLKESRTGYAVFENLDHDFPQRVIYSLAEKDSLSARIEGMQNGKPSGIDFPYKRVKCG